MNFALSTRRTDRHPVGLLVVVGLHGVLAAALLSARLVKSPPVVEPSATVLPDTPKTQAPQQRDELKPRSPVLPHAREIVIPPVDVNLAPLPAIAGQVESAGPPVQVASVQGDESTVHDAVRVLPRRAVINAGAAQCRPEYPAAAQRAGVTGVSRIRFSVDPSGRITGAQILQTSGPTRENRLLDKAAADALARCPVQVGTDDMGRPVGATADVDYVWTLNQ